jgi:hypothetical protein
VNLEQSRVEHLAARQRIPVRGDAECQRADERPEDGAGGADVDVQGYTTF